MSVCGGGAPRALLEPPPPPAPARSHGFTARRFLLQGVPKFYRWISERYPLINQAIDDATLLPHFDNLYLDMNGVIHGATHGDGLSKSLTDSEV